MATQYNIHTVDILNYSCYTIEFIKATTNDSIN